MSSVPPSIGKIRSKVGPVFFNCFPYGFDRDVAIDNGVIGRYLDRRDVAIDGGLILNRLEGSGAVVHRPGLDIG